MRLQSFSEDRKCCSSGVFRFANSSAGGPISCTRPWCMKITRSLAATGIRILSGVDFKTNRHNLFIVAVSIGLGMVLLIAPNFRQWMALNTRAFQKNADPTRVAQTLGAIAYML